MEGTLHIYRIELLDRDLEEHDFTTGAVRNQLRALVVALLNGLGAVSPHVPPGILTNTNRYETHAAERVHVLTPANTENPNEFQTASSAVKKAAASNDAAGGGRLERALARFVRSLDTSVPPATVRLDLLERMVAYLQVLPQPSPIPCQPHHSVQTDVYGTTPSLKFGSASTRSSHSVRVQHGCWLPSIRSATRESTRHARESTRRA
eukprot:2549453-Pyramimonas_sp.AAC.1